jgi:hypothetical protein
VKDASRWTVKGVKTTNLGKNVATLYCHGSFLFFLSLFCCLRFPVFCFYLPFYHFFYFIIYVLFFPPVLCVCVCVCNPYLYIRYWLMLKLNFMWWFRHSIWFSMKHPHITNLHVQGTTQTRADVPKRHSNLRSHQLCDSLRTLSCPPTLRRIVWLQVANYRIFYNYKQN